MKSIVLSNEYNVIQGMKLAGLDGVYSKNIDELENYFKDYVNQDDIGIIILTEELERKISDIVNLQRNTGKLPLIVTIPGENGLQDKNFIMKYIKESLGVKID